MRPRLLLPLLTISLLPSPTLAIAAQEEAAVFIPAPGPVPPVVTGFLRNDQTGEVFALPVRGDQQALLSGSTVVSYTVEIPTWMLVSPASTPPKEDTRFDSSRSVRATLQQYYTLMGDKWVAVHRYRARWERLDPRVSWRDARITAGCFGTFQDGGDCPGWHQTRSIGVPTSGSWYEMVASWAGRYLDIQGSCSYQGGSIHIRLQRGSTTWTFGFNVIQGNMC